jgi:ABC-type maltose transport system permease subunit
VLTAAGAAEGGLAARQAGSHLGRGVRLHLLLDGVLFAQVLARDQAITLPVVLAGIITGFQGNQYGEASALTMVSLIPALVIGILIQRHLVRGLTLGAVQG